MEMQILKALESIRSPFLDKLMQAFTFLGEQIPFMVLALILFWCVDKWKGYYLLSTSFLGTILSQRLKMLCRVPRPWVKDPSFTVVKSAEAGATGYSFPSGHTQGAACTYFGIARMTKRSWLRWVMAAVVLLVGFSRMYLGVHFPSDVGVGLLLGLAAALVLYPVFQRARDNDRVMYGFFGVMLLLTLGYLAFVRFANFPEDAYKPDDMTNTSNYDNALKNAWQLLGSLLGMLAAFTMDRKTKFSEQAPLPGQICKVVFGLAILYGIKIGLKPLFGMISDSIAWDALRYGLMVFFVGGLWPLSFPLWAKLGAKK